MITPAQIQTLIAEVMALPASTQKGNVLALVNQLSQLAAVPAVVTPAQIVPVSKPATPIAPPVIPTPVPAGPPTPAPTFVTLAQLQALNTQILAMPDSTQKTTLEAEYQTMALAYENEEEAGTVADIAPPQSAAMQALIAQSQAEVVKK